MGIFPRFFYYYFNFVSRPVRNGRAFQERELNHDQCCRSFLQREKQQKLNELDVLVVLRLSQIQYMLNSTIPQDLSPCLVFTGYGLVRLQHRIKELEKEKADQKRLYR